MGSSLTPGTVRGGGVSSGGSLTPGTVNRSKKKQSTASHYWNIYKKATGLELAGNAIEGVGKAAVGLGPGIVQGVRAGGHDVATAAGKVAPKGTYAYKHRNDKSQLLPIAKGTAAQYKKYYGPLAGGDVVQFGKNVYNDPVQLALDAATFADVGASLGVKAGLVSGERATIVTRSPRNVATGKGPRNVDITTTKPLQRKAAQIKAEHGNELKRYGKQLQAQANQHALANLAEYTPYVKATKRLNASDWTALKIRQMDIHPDDLAEMWKGTPAAKELTAAARAKALNPSPKLLAAEAEARVLSHEGAVLRRKVGRLEADTEAYRPGLSKEQASTMLGRPVREIHGDPYYIPDIMTPAVQRANPLIPSGGGRGPVQISGTAKQNRGVLLLNGKLHLRSDILGPEFLRRVKEVKYDEIHKGLIRGGVRVTPKQLEENWGGKLPKGWEFVRERASTKIPGTLRQEGDISVVTKPEDIGRDGFATLDHAKAHQSGGYYYIAPKSTIKAAAGEFTRSSDFVHAFVKKPLAVWRSIVLGLRVGFLTNNLVGNSIMYAVRVGGTGAMRDLYKSFVESHGKDIGKRLLDDPATPPALRQSLYQEFFPEQMMGTFGRTQSPSTDVAHIAGSKAVEAGRAVTGALPKVTSAVAETGYRRALIRNTIRRSPEFKKTWAEMPKETRQFETAARNVLKNEGKPYQRYVSRQVDRALGNYINLGSFERNVMRNLLPFYSWYKAITKVTLSLAIDSPLRANILYNLGKMGREWSDEQLGEVPSFLKGSIPLGPGDNGTKKVLGTQSLIPYATIEQLRRGGLEDVNNLGLNPFAMAIAQAFAEAQHGRISPGDIAAHSLYEIGRNLPPIRLAFPLPPSKLYPNRGHKSEGLSFVGLPVKEYDSGQARSQAKQGR